MVDIVEVKTLIDKGRVSVLLQYGNVILKDMQTGEAVKLGVLSIK